MVPSGLLQHFFYLYSWLEELQFGTKKDTEDKEMMKGLLTNQRTTWCVLTNQDAEFWHTPKLEIFAWHKVNKMSHKRTKFWGGGGGGGGGCLCMCNKNHGQHNKISNHNKIIFFIVTTKPLVCIQNVYSPCWKVPIWLLAVFVFWIIVQLDFKIFQPMKITFPCGLEASELNFGSRGPGLRPGWVIVLGSQTK